MRSRGLKKSKLPRRDLTVLFVAFFICAVVLGALLLKKYETRTGSRPTRRNPTSRGFTLLRCSLPRPMAPVWSGRGGRSTPAKIPRNVWKRCVGELINGPLGNLPPPFPLRTSIRSIRINGDVALLDLGDEVAKGLPGGSNSEMTAVYSIVNTIAVNFPRIKMVKLMLNGKDVETLSGHLDLRKPLAPDFASGKEMRTGKRLKRLMIAKTAEGINPFPLPLACF